MEDAEKRGTAPVNEDDRHDSSAESGDRTDRAGFDTQLPPGVGQERAGNPGSQDGRPVENDGWREFHPAGEFGGEWTADEPYPGRTADPDAEQEEAEAPVEARASGGDLLAAVSDALEADAELDATDISVEQRGGTIYLRGSAATPEDRERAAEIAASVEGVEEVENLLAAGS